MKIYRKVSNSEDITKDLNEEQLREYYKALEIMKKYPKAMKELAGHSSEDDGYVGIWWIYEDNVIGEGCPVDDGVDDRGYIQFDKTKNHITQWESTIKENVPESDWDIIPKGYRSLERGRVVYNIRAQVFEIICSETIANNSAIIEKIAKEFNITNTRYDVIASSHYYVPTLTGNPALDNFDFD